MSVCVPVCVSVCVPVCVSLCVCVCVCYHSTKNCGESDKNDEKRGLKLNRFLEHLIRCLFLDFWSPIVTFLSALSYISWPILTPTYIASFKVWAELSAGCSNNHNPGLFVLCFFCYP